MNPHGNLGKVAIVFPLELTKNYVQILVSLFTNYGLGRIP